MARIRYIGKKDQKPDNVTGTGVVWLGKGDVQTVPDEAVSKLVRHADVWELADEHPADAAPQGGLADAASGSKGEGEGEGDAPPLEPLTAEGLAQLDDAQLKGLADVHELDVDRRQKGDKLRVALLDAQAKKAEASAKV